MSAGTNSRKNFWILFVIISAYLVYSGVFIYKTSFVIEGERYYSLFDDAMVSMRYAENFANGDGPVWNPGDKAVEGYTNPLWMIYMSFFHSLDIAKSKISLFIQLSAALIMAMNLFFLKKLSDLVSDNSNIAAVAAMVLTALYLPLNNWSLQGMEVSIITLILTVTTWLNIKNIRRNVFSIWQLLLPGIGILFRIDTGIAFMIFSVFLIWKNPDNRKKIIISGSIILFMAVLAQTLFRLHYYGELLPNTYYLKMTGYPFLGRIGRGIYTFLKFIFFMNPLILFAPLVLVFLKRTRAMILIFFLFMGQVCYSIYVGGDAWEWWGGSNRFVSVVMPLFFVLLGIGIAKFNGLVVEHLGKYYPGIGRISRLSFVIIMTACIFSVNSIYGPYAISELFLLKKPFAVEDNINHTALALEMKKILKHDAKAAVVTAGVIPYFMERHTYDILGKNDPVIARQPMHVPSGIDKYIHFNPGHLKWDYSYSIGELKPDAILHLWKEPEKAKPILDSLYKKVKIGEAEIFLLKGSKNIYWDKIAGLCN